MGTWDVPLDIHLSSCPAHSPTRLWLKLIFGRTEKPTNTRREKCTNFQRFLTKRSPDFTCQLSQSSLMSFQRIKPNTLIFPRLVHTSTISTDTDQYSFMWLIKSSKLSITT